MYAWGLGIASNNLMEAYALMQGLKLAIEANIHSLIIIGDSKLVIGKMVSKIVVVDYTLDAILEWAKKEVINFSSINFFHVLWENNQVADHYANKATLLKEGLLALMEIKPLNPFHSFS
jgi:ribonuclease HI